MKITLESYGTKVSVEKERDDLTVDDVVEMFETLLLGAGYTQEAIDQVLR